MCTLSLVSIEPSKKMALFNYYSIISLNYFRNKNVLLCTIVDEFFDKSKIKSYLDKTEQKKKKTKNRI